MLWACLKGFHDILLIVLVSVMLCLTMKASISTKTLVETTLLSECGHQHTHSNVEMPKRLISFFFFFLQSTVEFQTS